MPAADEYAARVQLLREAPAYRAYEFVREQVLRYKDRSAASAASTATASPYWSEELANIEYLLDASPLVVEKLRHHCYHVTGVWPFNYRSHLHAPRRALEAKLAALAGLGSRDLLVPEARELGGFGFEVGGRLYNTDTLKYFEVLLALDRGGALGAVRGQTEHPVVCEIGSGWGGFAYQFKTLFPSARYALVDLPELFLLSATYLMTLFPDARFAFWGDDDPGAVPPEEADFLFIPNYAYSEWRPARLDLTVNMVSFQEMTTDQVRGYVHWAAEHDTRYLYSLNRDRSYYNPDLANIRELIGERFELQEIPMLPVDYTQPLRAARRSPTARAKRLAAALLGREASASAMRYRHVVASPRAARS